MTFFQINRKLLLMKIHYFIGIGGYAPFSPFLTMIAKQRGYSAFIVGVMFTLQPLPGLIIRPIMGAVTDKYKCRRSVIIVSSALIFLLVCLLLVIPGTISREEMNDLEVLGSPLFWLFFSTISLINVISTVRGVLEDTICMQLLGENKNDYGKQRLWGSVGWSLMAVVSGVCVDMYSQGQEFKNYTPGFIMSIICFFIDIFIISKIEVKQESNTTIVASNLKKVLTEGKVIAFLLWVVLFGFFMSFIWNFLFWYLEDLSTIYHPETLSWIKTLQGIALIIQCFAGEVPCFFLSSHILKRVDHMTIFSLMFFTFTLIYSAYSVIKDPILALPVEILSGLTFAMSYSAAISYADRVTPVGAEGTLQGVVGTALSGIGAPAGSFVGGYMFKQIGSIATFKILSVMAFVTCIIQITVNHLINRFFKNKDAKTEEVYDKVATKESDDVDDNTTTLI